MKPGDAYEVIEFNEQKHIFVDKSAVSRESFKTDRRCVVLTLTKEEEARFNKIEKDMYEKFKRVFSRIPKDRFGEWQNTTLMISRRTLVTLVVSKAAFL